MKILFLVIAINFSVEHSVDAQQPSAYSSSGNATNSNVGLRDHIAFGLSVGTMTGAVVRLHLPVSEVSAIRLGVSGGAGVARWSIGLAWNGMLAISTVALTDHVNNALLISPGIAYGTMAGESTNRGFIDFSPRETVPYVSIVCSGAWVHQYSSWSIELSLEPGIARALGGQDSGGTSVSGEVSFQLSLVALARF